MSDEIELVEVHPVFNWLTPERRAWLYRVAFAVLLLAGGYGLVSGDQIPLILGAVGAFVGTGTAVAHTPS